MQVKEADRRQEQPGFSSGSIMSLQCIMTTARLLSLHICKEVAKVMIVEFKIIIVETHSDLCRRQKEGKKYIIILPQVSLEITYTQNVLYGIIQ